MSGFDDGDPGRPAEGDTGRLEGYRPRRPVSAERVPPPARDRARASQTARRTTAGRHGAGDRAGGRRTLPVAMAVALSSAALVIGLMLGWVARGGPPKAELVVTTQDVPAVTVTKEVSP